MTNENNKEMVSGDDKQFKSEFDGSLLSFIGWSLLGGFMTFASFGLATPWAICMIYHWRIDHTVIDGRRLQFNGKGGYLFVTWLKWMFFIIITFGIYSLWVVVLIEKWKVKNTSFANKE